VEDGRAEYLALAEKVLGMLRRSSERAGEDDHLTLDNWEWPTGVALYSLFKIYKKAGIAEFRDYLSSWYERKLAGPGPHRNVNTIAPLLALAFLYEEEPRPRWRESIEDWASWVTKEMPRTLYDGLQHMTVLNSHYQQLWDDTLYMAGLFLAKAGLVLGRPELVEEAKYQFLVHIKYLQDKLTGLFYHGWTFDYRNNFADVFWARGNSWFTSGAVELLEMCGDGDASTRFVRNCLVDQAKELVKHQLDDGRFTTILDSEESYPETSATANIAYALMKGARLGLLPGEHGIAGERAARAVIGQVAEDGTVQGVSYGTGMGSSAEHYRAIPRRPTAYGQGLCLLMLSELV